MIKILVLLLFTLVGMLLFSIYFTTIYTVFMRPDTKNLMHDINFMKGIQLFASIGTFTAPALVFAFLVSSSPFTYLNLNNKISPTTILIAIAGFLAISPLINLTNVWNESMNLPTFLDGVEKWMREKEETTKAFMESILLTKSVGGLIFNIFLVGIIAGVGEELFFRGILQKLILQITKNTHAAIWITAFIFSAIHVQFYGFLPRFLLGALFGYLLVWTGSLIVPIILHTLNNSIAVIIYFLKGNGNHTDGIESFGTNDTIWYSIAGFIVFAILMQVIIKKQSGYLSK